MFPRKIKVPKKGGFYTYVQLVQSYRRSHDKMPATKVIANLGELSDLEFENLRNAFDASKNGKTVVVRDKYVNNKKSLVLKPTHNLRYLNITVLLEIWREYGFETFLNQLFQQEEKNIDPSLIVTSLVLHRCDDPGSKLAATRWFPKTALPELFAIDPQAFNNTRIHRSLELIEQYNQSIMAKMPYFCRGDNAKFASFFLDVSDATFYGHGPSQAKRGRSKEGAIKRKIGIVLLCNEEGFPLRWEVVDGNANDSKTMMSMIREISDLKWVAETPLVCDRAMGKSAHIAKMWKAGVYFITALTRTEIASYAPNLPTLTFQEDLKQDKKKLFDKARELARKINIFTEIDDNLFVIDTSEITKRIVVESENSTADENRTGQAMEICKKINQLVADQKYSSAQAAGSALGFTKHAVQRYRKLGRLPLDIQSRILSGEAKDCSIDDILTLIKLNSPDEMISEFENLIKTRKQNPTKSAKGFKATSKRNIDFSVKVVTYFNPEIFIEKKIGSQCLIDKVQTFENNINSRLENISKRRTKEHVFSEISRYLQKDDLLEAFQIELTTNVENSHEYVTSVAIRLNKENWEKRHRYDGFSVLVCNKKIKLSASEICKLYRDKNQVEADFKTIKSVLEIQPVRHRRDEKVRAHVTICMLALFLEKAFQKKLGDNISTERTLEILDSCFLNRYSENNEPIYSITEPTKEQLHILKKLNLKNLSNDTFLTEKITPRV